MRDFIKVTRDKMTAAVLYGKRDVRIEQIPIPRVARGEVLVRIKAALTCGTDLKVYRQGFHARMIVPPRRTIPMACCQVSVVPTASITTSAPRLPFVILRTCSTTFK